MLEHLKWAIAGALLLASIGLAAALYANSHHQRAAQALAGDEARFRQTRERLDSVFAERREIDEYLPRFNTLKSLGALGNENRLEWIERIGAIRSEMRLPRLAYTIEPRQASATMQAPAAGLSFETSRMKLEFGLVHEGDFVRLIERLRSPPMGVFEIRLCVLVRRGADASALQAATTRGPPGNLDGECEIDWISLTGAGPAPPSQAVTGKL